MLNQVVLVGKITDKVLHTTADGNKVAHIELTVQRAYRNSEGVFESDVIPVTLWHSLAENTIKHCPIGSTIGVKGTLVVWRDALKVTADKITYITMPQRTDVV